MSPFQRTALAAIAIVAAVFAVYWGTFAHELLSFDDRKYLYENPLVVGDGGIGAIWADLWNENPTLHYNPLTYTTFWLEHAWVGLGPEPEAVSTSVGRPGHPVYHVTQAVLHAGNALLLLLLFRALGVGLAASVATAALWAVHPMCVASVAWVAERKNLVSVFMALVSLLAYVCFRRRSREPPLLYAASLAAFALALSAKGAVMSFPAAVVASDRLLDGRFTRSALMRSLPFFLLAAVSSAIVATREAHITVPGEPVSLWMRPFVAAAALVHYLLTVFAPVSQAIIYPRWDLSLAEPRYVLSVAFLIALVCFSWGFRLQRGDHWFWGLALFVITTSPMLGLLHFGWMQFAFVSDHYLYLGGAGILLAVVTALDRWRLAGGAARSRALAVCLAVALALCAVRTVQQSATWRNNLTLWEHTLTVSPRAAVALINLGNHHARRGDHARAFEYYSEWARVRPDFVRAGLESARSLQALGRHDEAVPWFARALEAAERKGTARRTSRVEYARALRRADRLEEALAQYRILFDTFPEARGAIAPEIRELVAELPHAGSNLAPSPDTAPSKARLAR